MALACGTIDIGNTRVKLRYAEFNTKSKEFHMPVLSYVDKETFDIDVLKEWVSTYKIQYIACSSSGYVSLEISKWFQENEVIILSHKSKMPIEIKYDTPETLGRDRIAVAIAANSLFPKEGNLVIDIGTCITYDWINEEGVFLGGNISPGIHMRLQAMHEKTASLPLADANFNVELIGHSTISALQHGAVLGTICEIESFIDRSAEKHDDLVVILTGGDAAEISSLLKKNHIVHPTLLHVGLCELIRYNYDEFK